jgi:hypothetical protein
MIQSTNVQAVSVKAMALATHSTPPPVPPTSSSSSSRYAVDAQGVPIIPFPAELLAASVIASLPPKPTPAQVAAKKAETTPPPISSIDEAIIRRLMAGVNSAGRGHSFVEHQAQTQAESEAEADATSDNADDASSDEPSAPSVTAESDPKLIFSQRRHFKKSKPEPDRGKEPLEHKHAKHFVDPFALANEGQWDTKNDRLKTVNGVNVGFHNPKTEARAWSYWKQPPATK